jgi:putative ABC transport system permease protein
VLQSAFKTALRGLLLHPLFAAINILGLSGGLACSLLIFAYVQHELGYESFNERAQRLYLLTEGDEAALFPVPLADMMRRHMPQVEAVAAVGTSGRPLLTNEDRQAFHKVMLADQELFDLLDLPFRYGDRSTALVDPYSMVISTRIANQFFGDRNPVGETMRWDTAYDFQISGVFEPPSNTHYAPELILSLRTIEVEPAYGPIPLDSWEKRMSLGCYVLLAPGATAPSFGDSLMAVARRAAPEWLPERLGRSGAPPLLKPVAQIHLGAAGHRHRVHLLAVIGVFVLLVACVNFINLSTARSAERVKEIGIRKAVGVGQGQLTGQFLLESVLQVLLAAILGAAVAWACGPAYRALTGFELDMVADGNGIWVQGGGLLLVALLGAGYPAIVLARLHPTRVFRDASRSGSMGAALRRRLVEFQFALAILLAFGTAVAYRQLDHMRTGELGLDKSQVLTFKTGYMGVAHLSLPMLASMAEVPGVLGVAGYSDPPLFQPFQRWNEMQLRLEGREETVSSHGVIVNGTFLSTMGLQLLAGRSARPSLPRGEHEFVLNETAIRALGLGDPHRSVGAMLKAGWQGPGPVVGVVRDFHYQTMHDAIGPLVLSSPGYDNRYAGGPHIESYNNYLIRVDARALPEVLEALAAVWRSYAPEFPFYYEFLDEQFGLRHRAEQLLSHLLAWFAGTALLLTGLGVFAMAAYAAQQRTKEIGVRKVLGARRIDLLFTLGAAFARAFVIAGVVAVPVGIWAARRWLDGYPYHIDVGPGLVLLSLVAVLVTAASAMAHQVARASSRNPIDALRYE